MRARRDSTARATPRPVRAAPCRRRARGPARRPRGRASPRAGPLLTAPPRGVAPPAPGWHPGDRGPGRSYSVPVMRRSRRSRTARTTCHSGRFDDARWAGRRREDQVGVARAHRLDAHRRRGARDVAEEVLASSALHQLAQETAPPERHRRLLPDQDQDPRSPLAASGRAGRGQRGVERGAHRVRSARVTGQPAEQAADPADIGERVGVDPKGRDAELAQPGGRRRVLGRVVEHDEIGPDGENGLEVGIDTRAEVGHAERFAADSRTTRCGRPPPNLRRSRRGARWWRESARPPARQGPARTPSHPRRPPRRRCRGFPRRAARRRAAPARRRGRDGGRWDG